MGEEIINVMGDKLPTVYDVAISIFKGKTVNPTSGNMKYHIKAYVTALIDVWIKEEEMR